MKKQILSIAVALIALFAESASAQVHVSVNIGTQPVWGPVGYDHVDYYYIPDVDAYYDVSHRQYTYYEDNRWVTRQSLPPQYRGFDLYGAHKVVINEPNPWMRHDRYRDEYARYRGQHDQQVIRDSREERYYANPQHPHHNEWHGNNGHGNNGHRDNGHRDNGHRDNGNHGNKDRGEHGHEGHGKGHGEHGH